MEHQDQQTLNKWRLILGSFSQEELPLDENYREIDHVLDFLYSREYGSEQGIRQDSPAGGRGQSQLTVSNWITKLRKLFPAETVEIMQKQAIEKYDLKELLADEKILRQMQPDMELMKNILTFKDSMNPKVLEVARELISEVVQDIQKMLEEEVRLAFSGKKDPYKSSSLKSMRNFDFKKTIRRNLKNYDAVRQIIIPERLYFCSRVKKQNEYHIIIVVDESGSMLSSVIYTAIMAGIFSKLNALQTDLIIFDTNIVDLSDYVSDPVEVLMSVQLGGGTDISKALDYTITKITRPLKTIVVLVSDLYDGYDYRQMYRRVSDIIETGARMFVLPALDFEASGCYDRNAAQKMADLGAQVAAITPKELAQWIAKIIL